MLTRIAVTWLRWILAALITLTIIGSAVAGVMVSKHIRREARKETP